MAIISLVVTLFFTALLRLGNYHKSRERQFIMSDFVMMANDCRRYGFEEKKVLVRDTYRIEQEYTKVSNLENLYRIDFKAISTTGKQIGKWHTFILADERILLLYKKAD